MVSSELRKVVSIYWIKQSATQGGGTLIGALSRVVGDGVPLISVVELTKTPKRKWRTLVGLLPRTHTC